MVVCLYAPAAVVWGCLLRKVRCSDFRARLKRWLCDLYDTSSGSFPFHFLVVHPVSRSSNVLNLILMLFIWAHEGLIKPRYMDVWVYGPE